MPSCSGGVFEQPAEQKALGAVTCQVQLSFVNQPRSTLYRILYCVVVYYYQWMRDGGCRRISPASRPAFRLTGVAAPCIRLQHVPCTTMYGVRIRIQTLFAKKPVPTSTLHGASCASLHLPPHMARQRLIGCRAAATDDGSTVLQPFHHRVPLILFPSPVPLSPPLPQTSDHGCTRRTPRPAPAARGHTHGKLPGCQGSLAYALPVHKTDFLRQDPPKSVHRRIYLRGASRHLISRPSFACACQNRRKMALSSLDLPGQSCEPVEGLVDMQEIHLEKRLCYPYFITVADTT